MLPGIGGASGPIKRRGPAIVTPAAAGGAKGRKYTKEVEKTKDFPDYPAESKQQAFKDAKEAQQVFAKGIGEMNERAGLVRGSDKERQHTATSVPYHDDIPSDFNPTIDGKHLFATVKEDHQTVKEDHQELISLKETVYKMWEELTHTKSEISDLKTENRILKQKTLEDLVRADIEIGSLQREATISQKESSHTNLAVKKIESKVVEHNNNLNVHASQLQAFEEIFAHPTYLKLIGLTEKMTPEVEQTVSLLLQTPELSNYINDMLKDVKSGGAESIMAKLTEQKSLAQLTRAINGAANIAYMRTEDGKVKSLLADLKNAVIPDKNHFIRLAIYLLIALLAYHLQSSLSHDHEILNISEGEVKKNKEIKDLKINLTSRRDIIEIVKKLDDFGTLLEAEFDSIRKESIEILNLMSDHANNKPLLGVQDTKYNNLGNRLYTKHLEEKSLYLEKVREIELEKIKQSILKNTSTEMSDLPFDIDKLDPLSELDAYRGDIESNRLSLALASGYLHIGFADSTAFGRANLGFKAELHSLDQRKVEVERKLSDLKIKSIEFNNAIAEKIQAFQNDNYNLSFFNPKEREKIEIAIKKVNDRRKISDNSNPVEDRRVFVKAYTVLYDLERERDKNRHTPGTLKARPTNLKINTANE